MAMNKDKGTGQRQLSPRLKPGCDQDGSNAIERNEEDAKGDPGLPVPSICYTVRCGHRAGAKFESVNGRSKIARHRWHRKRQSSIQGHTWQIVVFQ